MANILDELTRYRVKVEKDGKEVVNIPGILCIPGLIAAPKMGILGMIAAPLLGCSIHVENVKGSEKDIDNAVKEAVKAVADTAEKAAKTIREEMDKAWQSVSAGDEPEEAEDAAEDAAEEAETEDPPAIHVKPDDSEQA